MKHPRYKWVATYREGGSLRKRYFNRKQDAEDWAFESEEEGLESGIKRRITDEERSAVFDTRESLKQTGASLREAIEFYCEHWKRDQGSCTVATLVDEVLLSKAREGRSKRYQQDLYSRLSRFKNAFGNEVVTTVTPQQISNWLAELKLASTTIVNFRRLLVLLFNEGRKRGYCHDNPAAVAEKPKVIESEVGILTVKQLEALLRHSHPDLLPFLTLGAFAGLRRAELERLDWKDVDLASNLIRVKATNAKSARSRFVKISQNLRSWLRGQSPKKGLIATANYRKQFLDARKKAKLANWPNNALRHSYASYHLAEHRDAAALALELGHTNSSLVFAHYRQLVKPAEARKYWVITPKALNA